MSTKRIEQLEGKVAALQLLLVLVIGDSVPPSALVKTYLDMSANKEIDPSNAFADGRRQTLQYVKEMLDDVFGDKNN